MAFRSNRHRALAARLLSTKILIERLQGPINKRSISADSERPRESVFSAKQGFDIPLLGWFRKELWGKINDDLLSDTFIRDQGIFNPDTIKELKQKLHSSNPEDSHETIWALMVFQHWFRNYIGKS